MTDPEVSKQPKNEELEYEDAFDAISSVNYLLQSNTSFLYTKSWKNGLYNDANKVGINTILIVFFSVLNSQ